ncbi:hypothetical protein [Bacillus altitudinis]|nr:hypothetical protein [Bacillus altitudinis]
MIEELYPDLAEDVSDSVELLIEVMIG